MEVADITIIGSGIASTVTLIALFDRLAESGGRASTSVRVIEQHDELFKGIPYGSRSSVNALTITSVHDFINEDEHPVFFKWLKDNLKTWSEDYRERGGITAARWLDDNLPLIAAEAWEQVYIPRYLYGDYLHERLGTLMERATTEGRVTIEFIKGEVTSVVRVGALYELAIERPDKTIEYIQARKLALAIGSAPVRSMYDGADAVYINDMYRPSAADNMALLKRALGEKTNDEERNILVIGSNASSIELLYLLEGLPGLRALINKTVIISTSGILPYHVSTEQIDDHPTPALDALGETGGYDIKTLVDAACSDLRPALANGANMDYIATIVSNTLKMMEHLGDDAKKAFFGIHGIKLRDMFRRSGPEYKGRSQALIDNNEALLLKGRYMDTVKTDGGVRIRYQDPGSVAHTYPLTFKAIINCSGSDDLDKSSSRLMNQLVNSGLCKMNLSRKGIEVNERFEAAPNLYVMGPLLGGNMNARIHFWHLENASRLTSLAPYLVAELLAVRSVAANA